MRVAFSSDNHLDINQVDAAKVLPLIAAELRQRRIDYYVNTGDTFNDFQKTTAFYAALQSEVGKATQVRFIAGNHDMVRGATYPQLESTGSPQYLHNKAELLPGTNTVLVGNNGWYDYSFVPETLQLSAAALAHWKRAFWIDGVIEQPGSDADRMVRVLAQVEETLRANFAHQVIFATHFVPQRTFLAPQTLRTDVGAHVAAFLGSQALGDLLARYQVQTVAFGHLHHRNTPTPLAGVQYLHAPVGYGTKRRHEWVTADFMTEWRSTLQIIEVNAQ